MRSRRMMTLAFCAVVAVPLLSQSQMRPGRWEITTQMDMPGMPVKMPPQKVTRCVTPEEANAPANTLGDPGGRGRGGSNCKVTDQKIDGNKVTWKMACTGADAMTGEGELVFKGDSYAGKMSMSMAQGQMTMQYTGTRVGDCTK
ncbi:MAG TPA: DUF3617 family protein [Vicinamibacterales bacterium]|nr:DUF3617 family protein [Vicinamibacterales bacterium]